MSVGAGLAFLAFHLAALSQSLLLRTCPVPHNAMREVITRSPLHIKLHCSNSVPRQLSAQQQNEAVEHAEEELLLQVRPGRGGRGQRQEQGDQLGRPGAQALRGALLFQQAQGSGTGG